MNVPAQCPITPGVIWDLIQFYTGGLLYQDYENTMVLSQKGVLGFTDFFVNI